MTEFEKEKSRRIYYQDIVYQVCNSLDRIFAKRTHRGEHVVCGTAETPSTQIQDLLPELEQRCREWSAFKAATQGPSMAMMEEAAKATVMQPLAGVQAGRVFVKGGLDIWGECRYPEPVAPVDDTGSCDAVADRHVWPEGAQVCRCGGMRIFRGYNPAGLLALQIERLAVPVPDVITGDVEE